MYLEVIYLRKNKNKKGQYIYMTNLYCVCYEIDTLVIYPIFVDFE